MISASFKRFWPLDRVDRLQALQAAATKAGFRFDARNGGSRTVFLAYITFSRGSDLVASFWNINDAETWLQEVA
ncbi:MAG: hypothetical protein EOS32_30335 [Mesorhizobium sp.]|uniref:hypothetical protein n=1 Tax=Mesorhizobium sp. TaxID=1871066 RepID=UPI000FE52B5F|nr:hypothetical protein [Mesorhizobium sp.]RWC88574.1 MAG: hypothetical protein EOS32_30335 [Mesorhizobium sp.]